MSNSPWSSKEPRPGFPWPDKSNSITPPIFPNNNLTQDKWEKMMRQIQNRPAPDTMTGIDPSLAVFVDPAYKTRTLAFKGIIFTAYLSDNVLEFFEREKDITRDELRLLEIAHPEAYSKIKQAWMTAWKDLQALNAFEKD